ncbi:MAG: HD domain-containing protein [Oscillospiraceae bacterium]|nr:HD domain-containing protein [Oscillospiraceae bacterium]
MRSGKNFQLYLFVSGCILINYLGRTFSDLLQLPVWLDAVGTVFSAYALGPVCGAIVGAATNIIYSFHSAAVLFYALTNISVGIIVGVFEKKGYLKSLFGVLSAAFVVTLLSVAISTPMNFFLSGGAVGNIWGDGVVGLMQEMGFNKTISRIAGQFYVDFLDKTLTMLLLYIAVKLWNMKKEEPKEKKNNKKMHKGIISVLAVMLSLLALFPEPDTVYAEEAPADAENGFGKYIYTVYNGENGLPGGMANDIVQTKDGVLWIGTYGGLYRYCGNELEWIKSVRTVNCLYTDEAGRLWIGTNDNGLSIFINDRITNVLNKDNGIPSNSVRCITEGTEGYYYAGTTDSLVVLTLSGGLKVYDTIPEIVYARRICADNNGNVAAVTDEGTLYLVRGTEVVASKAADKAGESYYSCAFDENGILYAGTSGNTVEAYDVSEGGFNKLFSIECDDLSGLNSLHFSDNGTLFICAENGAGYLSSEREYYPIETNDFNSSIEHMLIDYQGNYWFTSSRLGLLCLCPSVFTEIGENEGLSGNVVNTVIKWQGTLYVGTDGGLEAAGNAQAAVEDPLVQELSGIRIRCLKADSRDHLWICTSGKGIKEVSPDGNVKTYDSSMGTAGDKFRSVIETKDGTFAAAGDYGITFIKNGMVYGTIGSAEGLVNPKVLTLCEREDGSILAGTDGNGIAVIRNGIITETLKQENGLSSDIILRIVPDSDGGCFVVTGNGLCYLSRENEIRSLNNFPYYNNYDIIEGYDGDLFVLSSAGIFVANKTELLEGKELQYLLLDHKRGLRIGLTPNSWNFIDEDNNLFLSGDTGVIYLNLDKYDISVRSYRMKLKEIKADGESLFIDKETDTVIPSGASEIEIIPEIVNFSINDPAVSVYMEGFDAEPRIISQSELTSVVYSNMPSGRYVFHLAVLDSRTGSVIAENTYRLVKEKEIYENWWFRLYAGIVAIITIAYLTWLFVRTQIQKTFRMQKMELELTKNQLKMGNETILTIAKTVDAKDENTSQHSVRVSEYSVMIAKKLGYTDEECENLRKIAILHDIGKIGIPDSVLNKPARLTDEEYEIMRSHVVRGAEILKSFTVIDHVADGALYHHERYDGRGYVNGLKGEEIPLNARIIGLADAFDAMTANRVYRKQLDLEYVLEELRKGRGTQFDPKLVDIMLGLIDDGTIDVEQIYGKKLSEVYTNES